MKALITKDITIQGGLFAVYADKKLIQCYNFLNNQPEDSIWNEEKNYQQALELAKKIEGLECLPTGITVYETPTQTKEENQDSISKDDLELAKEILL